MAWNKKIRSERKLQLAARGTTSAAHRFSFTSFYILSWPQLKDKKLKIGQDNINKKM
jgi:hypothetical protein